MTRRLLCSQLVVDLNIYRDMGITPACPDRATQGLEGGVCVYGDVSVNPLKDGALKGLVPPDFIKLAQRIVKLDPLLCEEGGGWEPQGYILGAAGQLGSRGAGSLHR